MLWPQNKNIASYRIPKLLKARCGNTNLVSQRPPNRMINERAKTRSKSAVQHLLKKYEFGRLDLLVLRILNHENVFVTIKTFKTIDIL